MIKLGQVFILGDSYSTFTGHIPQGYHPYYIPEGRPETDVTRVEETWWHQLIAETDSTLVQNCSLSGTTICHTGYNGGDCAACSFVGRFDQLIEAGWFAAHPIDTLFVFGATNDSWAGSPLGEMMHEGWTRDDLYSVLPAVGYLTHRLAETLPNTRLIFLLNTGLKPEIADGIRDACSRNGIELLALQDIDKKSGHPTICGMAQIKAQVLAYLQPDAKQATPD